MRNILKNRLALSTVVTTLIILVVSVLLAGVVTYFAINVTSTRVQEESLHLTKQHVWYKAGAAGESVAAIMIINTGGRDVVIDKLTVRGQEVTWNGATQDVFYKLTTASISSDLKFHTSAQIATPLDLNDDLSELADGSVVTQATSDLTLPSGQTMIVYITSPDSITINDIGLTVAITVFTSQAMYYKETNVQAAI
jgi:heme/copper-type cytochrome/quinol oxidase subunit 2